MIGAERRPQLEPSMSIPQSVTEVLREHVELEVESIDRMYLNVYIPELQREKGVVSFFRYHRGATFASSALMAPMTDAFIESIKCFAESEKIPINAFAKGERKDEIAAKLFSRVYKGGRGTVHRQSAGKGQCVSDREAA